MSSEAFRCHCRNWMTDSLGPDRPYKRRQRAYLRAMAEIRTRACSGHPMSRPSCQKEQLRWGRFEDGLLKKAFGTHQDGSDRLHCAHVRLLMKRWIPEVRLSANRPVDPSRVIGDPTGTSNLGSGQARFAARSSNPLLEHGTFPDHPTRRTGLASIRSNLRRWASSWIDGRRAFAIDSRSYYPKTFWLLS